MSNEVYMKPCPFCGLDKNNGKDWCLCRSVDALAMSRKNWNVRPIEDALLEEISRLSDELGEVKKHLHALEVWNKLGEVCDE